MDQESTHSVFDISKFSEKYANEVIMIRFFWPVANSDLAFIDSLKLFIAAECKAGKCMNTSHTQSRIDVFTVVTRNVCFYRLYLVHLQRLKAPC